MTIYWTLKSVPELASLPRKQRVKVHEQCYRRHFLQAPASVRSIASFFSFIVVAAICMIIGFRILEVVGLPSDRWWSFLIVGCIGIPLGQYVSTRIAIPALRPFYRQFTEV